MEDCQVGLSYSPYFQSSSSSTKSLLRTMDAEVWSSLEQRTQEILRTIQPNVESELRRRIFTNYVHGLLVCHLPPELALQFYSFGSFPLKAYLPDGDIDLTALCRPNLMEGLARKICAILRSRQPQDSEFQIKDVHYIRARVKVVKFFVNNMAIDISFNQTAGLNTLCFLEQVDQLIGKDHLYKKSIILTKAWCYYESRILGAQYGLIASYGLETLVLFIINRFHSSLRGPLEVLHRFLEYYSTFDWGNYGISINGPFALSSLPEIIVTPQNEGEEFLLSEEFVRECRLVFPDPAVANAARVDEFQIKFLNIVDPLKDNNNLGCSVSKGNFCRIRSAFSLGVKKFREVLMLPGERRGMALDKFFATTLDRNGGGQRADLATPVPGFGTGTSEKSDLTGDYEEYCDSLLSANAYQFSITHNSAPPFEADDMSKWNALVHTAQQDGNVIFQMAENADQIFSCRLPHRVMQNQNNSTNVPPRARGKVPESSSCGLRMKSLQKTNQVEVSIKAGPSENAPWFKFLPEEQNDSTNVSPRARGKIPESSSRCPRMKLPQKTNQVEVSTEAGPSENAPQFKFSPEEFPQLPGTQMPSSSDVHQSAQTELASPPAKEFPQVTAATICFKRFKLDNDNDFPPLT
ncbi:hypothetical protein PS2_001568 [Malus domestica]|uniref:uncharacterized protein isoform X1 n=2 Tax=Malus domestica TaxID=3750 RepID=UPI0010AAB82F|nr:uncharacterized protein LOC103437981 isoform X1 [Malus domestica]XP_028958112.1 uncharacterized protein LOC103437981 isoform X1 [Malus domestica]XP_028958118.1 uncharacterized protein LOC103437981 isoform X1 [Malus domestica]